MVSTILSASHLHKEYGSGNTRVVAVDDVSMEIATGELVLIMGPSGSGKTTLLSMLGGILTPSSGRILLAGLDISSMNEAQLPAIRAAKVGFIFQAFNLLDALSARDNILLPAHLMPGGIKAAAPRADDLIRRLGIEKRQHALPGTLSGGEKQRVAIARALINQPPLILADEPTGNLDSQSGLEVMMVLRDIARDEGRAVILVTHDPRVEAIADRILWLEDGVLRDRREEQHQWLNCPVCRMKIDTWNAKIRHRAGQRELVFCTEQCKQKFIQQPERYMPAE
ncbi:MAG: ATP-binding cassette domain-containing protein [Gammaproteobacteria bacterium]|nr:ATP-binding cassette domain-containing protein [Gammaproteobacteria bacterium]